MHDSGCVNADVEIAQLRCLPLEPIAQPNRGTAGTAGNDSGHQAAYARTPQVNPLKTDVDVTYRSVPSAVFCTFAARNGGVVPASQRCSTR